MSGRGDEPTPEDPHPVRDRWSVYVLTLLPLGVVLVVHLIALWLE